MKNKLLRLISCLLVAILLIPTVEVFAQTNERDIEQIVVNNLSAIETDLKNNNTDVVLEISKMINSYERILESPSEDTDIESVNRLIDTLSEMLDEYRLYQSGIVPMDSEQGFGAAIAAVVAWFNLQGYSLSAELLTHARDNTVLYSDYSPVNGYLVKNSNVFQQIALGTSTSGSGAFEKSGTSNDYDLYYSIHSFYYSKIRYSSRTVTIRDIYDFAPGDYSGIAGITIDTMYKAQEAGVIVPFNTVITQTYIPW